MNKDVRKLQCEEAVRMLLEYLDKELDAENHAAMHAHLHTCRSCYSRFEFENRLKTMVKDQKEVKAPDALRSRLKKITDKF